MLKKNKMAMGSDKDMLIRAAGWERWWEKLVLGGNDSHKRLQRWLISKLEPKLL